MNENGFVAYLKQTKTPERSIKGYAHSTQIYATFLKEHRQNSDIDEAAPQDIADFVNWGRHELPNIYHALWGIKAYYHFAGLEELECSTSEWMEKIQNETRRLGEFPGVDKTAVKKLKLLGISTASQLLNAGKTKEDWSALAKKSGASLESIVELVKLSNIARLPGLKRIRGRLFYETGLDTLQKIAEKSPEEICKLIAAYVVKSGYDGIPPTLYEAESAVKIAQFLISKESS